MTFQAFKVGYIEFLVRLPPKERAVAIALLVLASGVSGLPGEDDLLDVIDTVLQLGGYPSQSAKTKHDLIRRVVGEAWADVVEHGLSALLPLDFSWRLGFSDLFPGTAIIKPSETDREREFMQLFGPGGGVLVNTKQAMERAFKGDIVGAVNVIAPKAVRDGLKAIEMWQTGEFKDVRGRLRLPATKGQAIVKGLGFQPSEFARAGEKTTRDYEMTALYELQREAIAEKWAEGAAELDAEMVKEAHDERRAWNKAHPDMRIDIDPRGIKQRVKSRRMTEAQRRLQATPRPLRSAITGSPGYR